MSVKCIPCRAVNSKFRVISMVVNFHHGTQNSMYSIEELAMQGHPSLKASLTLASLSLLRIPSAAT